MLAALTKGQRLNHLNASRETLGAWRMKICMCTKTYRYLFPLASFILYENKKKKKKSCVNREDFFKKKKSCESFNQIVVNSGDIFCLFSE